MSGTFGSFHQLELHHSVTGSFPPADVEVDHGARLLQGLHGSAVGHVPHVQLVHSEDDVVHPETHTSCQLTFRLLGGSSSVSWSGAAGSRWSGFSPQPAILGGGSSRDDLGDEDAGVFTDVRVVCAACDAEAQPRVTLTTTTQEDSVAR